MDVSQTLGEYLREQRRSKGFSLQDISLRTKVRTHYLKALEKGHYEQLPVDTYIKGFLGSYSELLDLDYEKLVELYYSERPAPVPPDRAIKTTTIKYSAPARRSPKIIPAVLALLFLGSGLAGWWFWSQVEPVSQVAVAQTVNHEMTAGEDVKSAVMGKDSEGAVGAGTAADSALVERQEDVPQAAEKRTSRSNDEKLSAVLNPQDGVTVAASDLPATLELEALEPVTVAIAIDGRAEQSYALHAGSVLRWRIKDSLRLHTKPDAVRLHLDDAAVVPDSSGRLQVARTN